MKILSIIFFIFLCLCKATGQAGTVKSNGIAIAYESFGNPKNETLIFINGTGSPLTDLPVELCKKIAQKGYRVIRFDNRDIGLSSHLDSLGQPDWGAIFPYMKTCKTAPLPYTLSDMAKDVIGLMDVLKIKKAHILFHFIINPSSNLPKVLFLISPQLIISLLSVTNMS